MELDLDYLEDQKLCAKQMDSQPKLPISTPFLQQRLLRHRSHDDEVLIVDSFTFCCCGYF